MALLISGGLDSSILLQKLVHNKIKIYPIYVRNGNYWEKIERYWLNAFLKTVKQSSVHKLTELHLPTNDLYQNFWAINGKKVPSARSKDEAVYLPGRNILLIAKTAIFCMHHRIHEIILASLKTNPFLDAKPEFFRQYSSLLSQALNFPIQIKTPLAKMTKKEVMLVGKDWRLDLTFSCIAPEGKKHCGKCNKCAERKVAFKTAGIKDSTHYAD